MTMENRGTWEHVGIDSELEEGPRRIPTVSHRGDRLDVLPLSDLDWPDFERLQWRILRDIEGLRHAMFYGEPGQAQLGLDLIAEATDGSGVALQSKKVKKFEASDIVKAIEAFQSTTRPFEVSRFILGVSAEVRNTRALDKFKELKGEIDPVELELWDQSFISEKLRSRPEIVVEFFGPDIAKIFCAPFVMQARSVPSSDATAVRQALARTPEVATGAREKIANAEELGEAHAGRALKLVEQAQAELTSAGFESHAHQYDSLRESFLVKLGQASLATRARLDQLWLALDQGHSNSAELAAHKIGEIATETNETEVRDHHSTARKAVELYNNPLASVPSLATLRSLDVTDRSRLAALAGETALAAHDLTWLRGNAAELADLADRLAAGPTNETLRTRLRILAVEGSGEWESILDDARKLQLNYELVALVQARHARYLALEQELIEADATWNEATANACLAEHWTDASRWVLSRRAFRNRWKPFTADDLLPVQTDLSARGPDQPVLPQSQDALEYGHISFANGKLRRAAIAAQRALRDAVTLGDWEGERRARRLLADILTASGEQLLAANHLVLAGETDAIKRLGAEHTTEFLDVTPHLTAKPWWIAGAAYRLIATQSDLVPDVTLAEIVSNVLAEINAVQEGTLVDLQTFTGSRYLSAIAVLAGLSERLTRDEAEQVVAFFESFPPVEENHYRHQDEDEAKVMTGILSTHPELADRALRHLVALLGRSQISRSQKALNAITGHMSEARMLLEEKASEGNGWAKSLIEVEHPEDVGLEALREARIRLETPLVHVRGHFSSGAGSRATSDAILVRTLPPEDQQDSLAQLLERGASPFVTAPDRRSYLLAASSLAAPPDSSQRQIFFECALTLAVSPPRSEADSIEEDHQHPLGAFRMTGFRDSRAEAAYLAASLASTQGEKERVRSAALGLIGNETSSEVWTTQALQSLGETIYPDIGFLSGQNWALRSLSAILWSQSTEPDPVGYRLATDPDVRVRRTLALQLVQNQVEEEADTALAVLGQSGSAELRRKTRDAVLAILREDSSFGVRSAAAAPSGSGANPTVEQSRTE